MSKTSFRNLFRKSLQGLLGLTLLASTAACNRFADFPGAQYPQPGQSLNGFSPNPGLTQGVRGASRASARIADQVVVQFNNQPNPVFLQQFAQQNGLQLLRVSPMGTALFRTLNQGMSSAQVMQSLRSNQMVAYSHPNTLYRSRFTVNDPRSSEQYGPAIIGAAKAWDITMGSPNVVIAIIDSGIDLQHPDLRANLVQGYNVLSQGQTPPQDDNGHGTHAAGIAAAVADNGLGVAGTCPRCKLMPLKVLDANGSGTGFDVALAVVWAVDNGAQVINMSLGGEESDPTLERAVKYALARGVSVVVAAGNESTDTPMYPAALPGVISVGSVDSYRSRSSFSNFGNWISVVAPGSSILSTMPMGSVSMTTRDGYRTEYDVMDGTSMAAPMVAGVVGLMRSRYPQLNPEQIKARLEGTAIDLGNAGFDNEFGNGMVDAFRAVM